MSNVNWREIEEMQAEEHTSISEWIQADAAIAGMTRPDVPWFVSNYDTWVRNPHYVGPSVPHPYEEEMEEAAKEWEEYLSTLPKAERDDEVFGTDYGPIQKDDCLF